MTLAERAAISHAKKQARAERDAEWLAVIILLIDRYRILSGAQSEPRPAYSDMVDALLELKARMTGETES